METILLFPLFIAFLIAVIALPLWIKRARKAGLEGSDMNKYKKHKVAEAGGIIVISSFIIGLLSYIAIRTFYFESVENLIEIFALLSSIIMLSFIGFTDDILGWKIGLRRRVRVILCLLASIPLIVINAGQSTVSLPFVGIVNLGLLYPLVLIPLGIAGASIVFNFVAGFNGLEAGQGILILGGLSIAAFFTGNGWLSLIGLCMVLALLAFWIYNKYPAKVFPGDVMTYPVGGLIAIMAILGNMEKIALFFFIPYIIEFVLKIRGGLVKESFGKPKKDGSLELRYNKIYGLEHFAIWFLKKFKKKVYEKDVVWFIHFIQIAVIVLGFIIFRNSIF